MTINTLYRSFLKNLETIYSPNEAANITKLFFESELNISRVDMIKRPDALLSEESGSKLESSLALLMNHTPIQYVIGNTWFHSLNLKVTPDVLIPRPETEELVSAVIDYLKNNSTRNLLEIGTGSGCISIAIKKNIPGVNITAIDISRAALNIAKENAKANKAVISFLEIDFLASTRWSEIGKFDLVVSNPPYIPNKEMIEMDKNVILFEPSIALFVPDENPLIFYKNILHFCEKQLSETGNIFMEIHEGYGQEVCALFSSGGYQTTLVNDLYGKNRIVIATRCL